MLIMWCCQVMFTRALRITDPPGRGEGHAAQGHSVSQADHAARSVWTSGELRPEDLSCDSSLLLGESYGIGHI